MQQNILTFREWNQNHVKVIFTLNGCVEVHSFNKFFFWTNKKDTIQNFKDFQNKELLKLYKMFFGEIQKKYTELIENIELVS